MAVPLWRGLGGGWNGLLSYSPPPNPLQKGKAVKFHALPRRGNIMHNRMQARNERSLRAAMRRCTQSPAGAAL